MSKWCNAFSKSVTMKKQTHRYVGFSAHSNCEDKYVKIKAHSTHTLLAGLMSQCSDSLSSLKPAFSRRDLHSSTTARQRRMEEKPIQKAATFDIQRVNLHTSKLMHVPVQCLNQSDYKTCDLGKKSESTFFQSLAQDLLSISGALSASEEQCPRVISSQSVKLLNLIINKV